MSQLHKCEIKQSFPNWADILEGIELLSFGKVHNNMSRGGVLGCIGK